MSPAADLLQFVISVGLPLGIAIVGALTTYGVARMQIPSRDMERRQERHEREEERQRQEWQDAKAARAEVIEGIAFAIAEYSETLARNPGSENDHRIRVELVKYSAVPDVGEILIPVALGLDDRVKLLVHGAEINWSALVPQPIRNALFSRCV